MTEVDVDVALEVDIEMWFMKFSLGLVHGVGYTVVLRVRLNAMFVLAVLLGLCW